MTVTNPAGNLAGTASSDSMSYVVWPWITTVQKFDNKSPITSQLSTSFGGAPLCNQTFFDQTTQTILDVGCSINKKNVPFNSQINVSTSKFDANSVTLSINIVDMFDTEAAQSQYQTTLTNSAKTLDVTAYYTAATGETVYV